MGTSALMEVWGILMLLISIGSFAVLAYIAFLVIKALRKYLDS